MTHSLLDTNYPRRRYLFRDTGRIARQNYLATTSKTKPARGAGKHILKCRFVDAMQKRWYASLSKYIAKGFLYVRNRQRSFRWFVPELTRGNQTLRIYLILSGYIWLLSHLLDIHSARSESFPSLKLHASPLLCHCQRILFSHKIFGHPTHWWSCRNQPMRKLFANGVETIIWNWPFPVN